MYPLNRSSQGPSTPDDAPYAIALSLDEWATVLSAIIRALQLRDVLDKPETDAYALIGRKIADACPQGSAPWFGGAMMGPGPSAD